MYSIRKTRNKDEWTIRIKHNNKYVIISKHATYNEAKIKRNDILESDKDKTDIENNDTEIEDV